MQKVIISSVLAILSLTATAQDIVSNIRVQQSDHILMILYDLAERADIEVFASFDGGETYSEPLKHVVGAVGKGIDVGMDRVIAWNVLDEVGAIDIPNMIVKIVSTNIAELDRIVHTIRFGETLAGIAKRYGVTVGNLQEWNNLRGTRIVVGRRLVVLNPKYESSATISTRTRYFDPIYDPPDEYVPRERRRRE